MNSACSATEGELAVPATISGTLRRLSAGTSTASKPTPIRVTTFMSLEASSSGSPKRVPPSATPWTGACSSQHGLEIPGRNHVGKFDDFDVVPRVEKRPSLLRHRFGDENLLLVGRHFLPLANTCAPSKDGAGHLV